MPQFEILDYQHKFCSLSGVKLLVGGFGSAKTFTLAIQAYLWSHRYPDFPGLILSEDFPILSNSLLMHMATVFDLAGVRYEIQEHKKRVLVYHKKKPTIIFWTYYTDPKKIIAYNAAWSLLDEIDRTREPYQVFKNVSARTRIDTGDGTGRKIALATTPEGLGFSYHIFNEHGDLFKQSNGYTYMTVDSRRNPHLDKEMLRDVLRNYTPEEKFAYVTGRWVVMNTNKVLHKFTKQCIVHIPAIASNHPELSRLIVGMDFNRAFMPASIFIERENDLGERCLYQIHEIVIKRQASTQAMISELKRQFPYSDMHIYPDASVKQATTASGDRTDLVQLQEAFGVDNVHCLPRNPPVESRVNITNRMFYKQRLFVGSNCKYTLRDIDGMVRHEITGKIEKDRLEEKQIGHCFDAFTYPVFSLFRSEFDIRYSDRYQQVACF